MNKEIKFAYKGLLGSQYYEAVLKNTKKGIEVSNVTKKYPKAEDVVIDMLSMEKPSYWGGDVLYNKEDRAYLKNHIDKEIQYQQERLERLKLLSKALTRKVYYLKTTS